MSHNKTLAAQLYAEFKEFFPAQRGPLLRQLLRLLPARGLHPAARHLHRERRLDQPGDRPPAAGGHQRPGEPPRRDHRGQRLLHLRPGLAGGLPLDDGRPERGQGGRSRPGARPGWSTSSTSGTTSSSSRGKFRVRGDCVEVWPTYEEYAFRIEFWGDEVEQLSIINPTSGEVIERQQRAVHLSRQALRHARGADPGGRRRDHARSWTSGSKQFKAQGKLLEAQRLSARTRFDLEMLQEVGYCPGIENYSRPLERPSAGLGRPTRCSASFPTTSCCSSTSRTSPCRRSAACTPATTTAR